MLREYPLTPELVAWHEAGHVAAFEFFGEAWASAHVRAATLSGCVLTNPEADPDAPLRLAPSRAEAVIGRTLDLRKISFRIATRLYAGVCGERLLLALPCRTAAFMDVTFPDFRAARYVLALTGSEMLWPRCARAAHNIVRRKRDRIATLSARLLQSGDLAFEQARQPQDARPEP